MMSVEVKTPTHPTQFDSSAPSGSSAAGTNVTFSASKSTGGGQNSSNNSASAKKRRQSHTPDERHGGAPGSAKKRRYSASRPRPIMPSFYKGGSVKDPLNLSNLENRTGPSPVPSPNAIATENARVQPRNVPKITNITDPLNLNVDIAAAATTSGDDGAAAELLSPTAQMRYKRKRVSKKLLQKLEIDFSDSDGEAKGAAAKLSSDKSAAQTDELMDRLAHPIDEKTKQTGEDPSVPSTNGKQSDESSKTDTAKTETADVQKAEIRPDTGQGSRVKEKPSEMLSKQKSNLHSQKSTANNRNMKHQHSQKSLHSKQTNSSVSKQSSSSSSSAVPKSTKPSTTTGGEVSTQSQQQYRGKQDKKNRPPPLFIHGNYNRYYGYRSTDKMETDPRLQAIKPSWLCNKSILDIGCNIGHVTLTIARDYAPERVVGVDIDSKLVSIARKNIRHYQVGPEDLQNYKPFPAGCSSTFGPISAPALDDVTTSPHETTTSSQSKQSVRNSFPDNISFYHGNYCLESDALLDTVRPEFNVILAFSVTKWMHLNNGDAGLKRCFKRMFLQLKPGGILVMEPQMWPSYVKKKNLTDKIRSNFSEITLKPDQFTEYLLSADVGFTTCERLGVQNHQAKGFRRPMFVFHKADAAL